MSKILLAGWFSLPFGRPTIGDFMSLQVLCDALDARSAEYDTLIAGTADSSLDYRARSASDYDACVWVCGPVTRSFEFQKRIFEYFGSSKWSFFNCSFPTEADEYVLAAGRPNLVRDATNIANIDVALSYPASQTAGGAALLLRGHQTEYGPVRCRCSEVGTAVRLALESANVPYFSASTESARYEQDGQLNLDVIERLLATADIVITTRLHGMVHAVRVGRPVVVIDQIAGGGKVTVQGTQLGIPVMPAEAVTLENVANALLSRSAVPAMPWQQAKARANVQLFADQLIRVRKP